MKKKNVLTMALSVSLVGVIAVGGTLAYLTANTGVVTNTFTASSNIEMNLTETWYENGVLKTDPDTHAPLRTDKASSYGNVLPDIAYQKDPAVQMTSVPSGGAYVFMAVTGLDTTAADKYTVVTTIDDEWEKITTGTGNDGLYVYVGEDTLADKWTTVQTTDRMTALFENVKFEFDSEFYKKAEHNINQIKVVAYSAQAQGNSLATVSNSALTTLNNALGTTFTINNEAVSAADPDAD